MRYELRKATPADEDWVYRLNTRCYRDLVVLQFGNWDEERQRGHFARKWAPSHYRIVVCNGRDVGVLCALFEEDHVFLSEIQIDPALQNRGLGTSIVKDLIRQAQQRGLPLRLRVLPFIGTIGPQDMLMYLFHGFGKCTTRGYVVLVLDKGPNSFLQSTGHIVWQAA